MHEHSHHNQRNQHDAATLRTDMRRLCANIWFRRALYFFFAYTIVTMLVLGFWYFKGSKKSKDDKIRNPPAIEPFITKSNDLKKQKNFDEALKVLDEGLTLYNTSDRLMAHRGGVFWDQNKWEFAGENYIKAFNLTNQTEHSHAQNAAYCLQKMSKLKLASFYARKAYTLKPTVWTLMSLVDSNNKLHDWTSYDHDMNEVVREVRAHVRRGSKAPIDPYSALHYPFTIEDYGDIWKSHAKSLYDNNFKECPPAFKHEKRPAGRRIKIGYVSYDFRRHAVGVQIQSMFEHHDRTKFEVYCYSVNDGARDGFEDETYKKIKNGVEHFVELGRGPLKNVSTKVYEDGIDILVDLGLYTAYSRMDLQVCKPAPINAAWLGLATSTGGWWMDYIVGDRVGIPKRYQPFYAEKILYMPHSYHIFDHKQSYPLTPLPDRAALVTHKIYPDRFYFCNFQNHQRLDPHHFKVWADMVRKSPNATLIMKWFNQDSAESLTNLAKSHGLHITDSPDSQFILIPGLGSPQHIEVKSACDIEVDVQKYNGHSTSGDMLWAGVPILTYPGESLAARAAASFLTTSGFPQMIAYSWEEYERIGLEAAANRKKFDEWHKPLHDSRATNPLFDVKRFVRNLERGWSMAYDRFQNGLSADHLYVEDVGPV